MTHRISFQGARVLVTGAGSGLGRLLAAGAAQRGAHVIVWDLAPERAGATRDLIRSRGYVADSAVVDVTDRAAVEVAAAAAGPVDVLINCAGVISGRALLSTTPQSIERTLAVNLNSLFWVTRAFLGGMAERGHGVVVTVSSAAGIMGSARMTDYAASKFGAFGFMDSLRNEMRLAHTGVRTLIVCPYFMSTGMFDGVATRIPLLMPILRPTAVAVKILNGIERGTQQLIMPPMVRTVPLLRLFPPPVLDAVADIFGINHTMDAFTGRPGDRV